MIVNISRAPLVGLRVLDCWNRMEVYILLYILRWPEWIENIYNASRTNPKHHQFGRCGGSIEVILCWALSKMRKYLTLPRKIFPVNVAKLIVFIQGRICLVCLYEMWAECHVRKHCVLLPPTGLVEEHIGFAGRYCSLPQQILSGCTTQQHIYKAPLWMYITSNWNENLSLSL